MRNSLHQFHAARLLGASGSVSSANESGALRLAAQAVVLCLITTVAAAQDSQVEQYRSLVTNPIAPRGGIMMVPLVIDDGASLRTEDVVLRDASGERLAMHLIWLQQAQSSDAQQQHAWTSDPRNLVIRPARTGDTVRPDRVLLLLAELPDNGNGEMHLGQQRLRPIWRSLPEAHLGERGGRLSLVSSPARPDPVSPFEYWRWVVMADQFDVEPPAVSAYGTIGSLIAEHSASLWSIALARLDEHNPTVGGQVRDTLTRICMDEQTAFAAWPADPAGLTQLLGLLLDFDLPIEQVVTEARTWLELQEMPLYWLESATAEYVHLAVVNPASRPLVARFNWVSEMQINLEDTIPLAVELPQGRLTRVRLERPELDHTVEESSTVLQIQVGTWIERLHVPEAGMVIQPPGLLMPPLQPPLTLARLQMDQTGHVSSERATLVQIRKRAERWEVFFECLRPMAGREEAPQEASSRPGSLQDVRGREGVTLFIGADENGVAPVQLFIPESGWHHLLRGSNDGTLQVHRRSYDDRWYCRVVLPDAWLNALLDDDVTVIGFMRTHSDNDDVQYGPGSAPPWRMMPGGLPMNLTQWDNPRGFAAQGR